MRKKHQQRLAKLAITFLDRLELYIGEPDRYELRVDEDHTMLFDMRYMCLMDIFCTAMPSQVNACGTSCCLLGFAPVVFPEELYIPDWSDAARFMIGTADGWMWDFLFSEHWSSDPLFAAMRCLAMLKHERRSLDVMGVIDLTDCVDEDVDGWSVGVLDYIDLALMPIYEGGKNAIKEELEAYL